MRLLVRLGVLVTVISLALGAQDGSRLSLVVEPGLLTTAGVSAPEGAAALTGFYMRVVVFTGSDSSRLKGILGASATPFGFRGSGVRGANTPSVFGGVQIELLPARLTSGWLSAYVPLLVVYSYRGGASENTRLYGADIAAEGTVLLHVGRKLFSDLGAPWSRLGAYVTIFQNLTPNVDATSGERDRFRPDFMYGISIPIVGSR